MIQLRDVTKRFGPPRGGAGTLAVRGVTLHIPRGESWAVVGPNGAGKTTLFALILGFLRPTSGEVELAGEEPRVYLRRHGAGYLPERFTLPDEWPVRGALLGLVALEGKDKKARARVDRVLDEFGLTDSADRQVSQLSHGARQRLGLAQAVLGDRDLIVLDEPTEGLDPLWRVRLRDIVDGLRQRGATVLLASHDLAEVERLADRVAVIDRGGLREVLETRSPPAPVGYALALDAESPRVMEIFPEAVARSVQHGALYHVNAEDAADLSRRLAALLDTGAVMTALQPLAEPLEERVRRVLGTEDV